MTVRTNHDPNSHKRVECPWRASCFTGKQNKAQSTLFKRSVSCKTINITAQVFFQKITPRTHALRNLARVC